MRRKHTSIRLYLQKEASDIFIFSGSLSVLRRLLCAVSHSRLTTDETAAASAIDRATNALSRLT